MDTNNRTDCAASTDAEPLRGLPVRPKLPSPPAGQDRLKTIKNLLACQCPRCGGDGWIGDDFNMPIEERVTCNMCSGLGQIEDDVHDNHLAWCVGEIERLRARDAAWQKQTGRSDPKT